MLAGARQGPAGSPSPPRLLEQVVLEDEPETISSEILLAQGYCCCQSFPCEIVLAFCVLVCQPVVQWDLSIFVVGHLLDPHKWWCRLFAFGP